MLARMVARVLGRLVRPLVGRSTGGPPERFEGTSLDSSRWSRVLPAVPRTPSPLASVWVVAMGAGPQVGEAVAGDVVNTASRMQSAAPPGGIVVGQITWLAIRDRFETEELEPFTAKGKSDPIRVWRVLGERAVATERPTA